MREVSGDIPVKRGVLPEGEAGVDETVARMVRMAHGKWGAKSPKVRALAINILNKANVPDKDYYGMIVAIHNWTRDNIRYVLDTVAQETISHPEETLFNSMAGDCDDQVIAEIALLASIGIPAWPVVVGKVPGQYSHVYLYAQVPPGKHRYANRIIPLDPIMREWPAGREAPLPAKKSYRQYATGSENTMDGLGFLGAYAEGPSYLPGDLTHSEVQIMAGRNEKHPRSLTTEVRASGHGVNTDGTIATGTHVNARSVADPMDGFFGGLGNSEGQHYHPITGHSAETRTRVVLADSSGVRGRPVAAQQMAARYSKHGQLENMAPMPVSASRRRLGPDGPMTAAQAARQEHLLPTVSAKPLTQMSVRSAVDGARVRRATPAVTVTDKPAFPLTTNGRAKVGSAKCPAEEVEELDGLSNLITLAGQDAALAGLGADTIGKGFQDQTLDETAVVSWWASWKRRLMQAVEKHADEVRRHYEVLASQAEVAPGKAALAKAEAKAARELRKAAEAVERQAMDLERVAVNGDPAKAQRIAATKAQLTELEKQTGEPGAIDALDAKEAGRKAAELVKENDAAPETVDGLGRMGARYRRAAVAARPNASRQAASQRQIEKARVEYAKVVNGSGDQATAEKVVAARGAAAVDAARSKKDTLMSRLKNWRRKFTAWLEQENGGSVRSERVKNQNRPVMAPPTTVGPARPPAPVAGLGNLASPRNLLLGALLVGGAAYFFKRSR